MEGAAPRRLPVWQTVIDAYRATFANWRYAVRISWAWFVPIWALGTLSEVLILLVIPFLLAVLIFFANRLCFPA